MKDSVWSSTLASFRDTLAGPAPLPASVSTASVAAVFALGLAIKVLTIASARKGFAGDRAKTARLIEQARREMETLARAADEDMAAFRAYMEARRGEGELPAGAAAVKAAAGRAAEVPLRALGAARRGVELCAEAGDATAGLLAADLAGAQALVRGAAEAIAAAVEANRRGLNALEVPAPNGSDAGLLD